mmetsp:Transcript_31647/g.87375  ORF Transcript_31647/g.87375 Transcript_31647/m.87375 type:complete len:270 (-) Transcript_31647:62-871(-)
MRDRLWTLQRTRKIRSKRRSTKRLTASSLRSPRPWPWSRLCPTPRKLRMRRRMTRSASARSATPRSKACRMVSRVSSPSATRRASLCRRLRSVGATRSRSAPCNAPRQLQRGRRRKRHVRPQRRRRRAWRRRVGWRRTLARPKRQRVAPKRKRGKPRRLRGEAKKLPSSARVMLRNFGDASRSRRRSSQTRGGSAPSSTPPRATLPTHAARPRNSVLRPPVGARRPRSWRPAKARRPPVCERRRRTSSFCKVSWTSLCPKSSSSRSSLR